MKRTISEEMPVLADARGGIRRGREQVRSQPCRQEPSQRSEDRAVGPVEPEPRTGAAQHGGLVRQHEQLGVLGGRNRPSKTSHPQIRTKIVPPPRHGRGLPRRPGRRAGH
jgi:hypothetical protein